MDGWRWRAWVGHPDGGKLGAAFLVAPARLLTCAHTVAGMDEARVGFPGLSEDLAARVRRLSDWRRPGDPGDVALLELPAPVPFAPARLAGPGDLTEPRPDGPGADPLGRRTFGIWGFPRRRDDDERYATVTTGPDLVLRQEWWQLKAEAGDWLEEGFSGSAVYAPATGEVVGMVTDAELGGDGGGRASKGRMLPLTSIRMYWEGLDDLLPLAWLTPEARRALRALLDGVRSSDPLEARLAEVTGSASHRRFRSAWDAVRYVAEGWPGGALPRFLRAAAPHLDERTRAALEAWSAEHLADAEAEDGAAPKPQPGPEGGGSGMASVIVRLERVTFDNAYDLTVHTWVDGAEGPAQRTVRVPERRVRPAVEEGVARARGAVVGRDWMIEFAVPETWLSKPFEEWYVDREHRIRMRMYPVVVRDVERLRPDSIRRDQAHHRWRLLHERGRSDPQLVRCGAPRAGTAFQDWLEANTDFCVLVYGTRPVKGWLSAALNTGVPVMLWTRTRCDGPSHDDCGGARVLDELARAVAGRHPGDLPNLALALRKKALAAPKDEQHCGRDLTLLWDDPSRLPDPPLGMEV